MKTTTPERFKVKPSNGCLSPGESSMMDIMVTRSHMSQSDNIGRTPQLNVQGDQLHRMTSVQDKFLISAVSVTGEDMSPHHINHQLKQSKPDAQYRLRCLMGEEKVTDKSQHIDRYL